MGTAESRSCVNTFALQQYKLERISNICCTDDVGGQNVRDRGLLVSTTRKNEIRKVRISRWKSEPSTDYCYCLDVGQSDESVFGCGSSSPRASRAPEKQRAGEMRRNSVQGESANVARSCSMGLPPGWSESEYDQLKDAIQEVSLIKRVKRPNYYAAQVRPLPAIDSGEMEGLKFGLCH